MEEVNRPSTGLKLQNLKLIQSDRGRRLCTCPCTHNPIKGLHFPKFTFYSSAAVVAVRLTTRVSSGTVTGSGSGMAIDFLADSLHCSLELCYSAL